MISNDRLSARVLLLGLRLLSEDRGSVPTRCLFCLHLAIQRLPLLEYLHQFVVHFIAIQLFQDVFLVLELVLRLPRLFRLLLFLNQRVGIFSFICAGIARFGLHTLVLAALTILLSSCRVLSVRRGLEVLTLRLSPL